MVIFVNGHSDVGYTEWSFEPRVAGFPPLLQMS